jgi:hypothetical protein
VVKQAADLDRVRDRGEQAESAAAARAGQCVDAEGPAHQSGPTALRLDAESAGGALAGSNRRPRTRGHTARVGDDARAKPGVGREDAMVEYEVLVRSWDERREALKKFEWREEDAGSAVGPWAFEVEAKQIFRLSVQAAGRYGRTQEVAE